MRRLNPDLTQKMVKGILILLTAGTISIMVFIICYLLFKGLPVMRWGMLSENPVDMGRSGGIYPFIVSTGFTDSMEPRKLCWTAFSTISACDTWS